MLLAPVPVLHTGPLHACHDEVSWHGTAAVEVVLPLTRFGLSCVNNYMSESLGNRCKKSHAPVQVHDIDLCKGG